MVEARLRTLAADLALAAGFPEVAAYCRRQVLALLPHHLLARWPRVECALDDPNYQALLRQIRRQYPPEHVEHLLGQLGIAPAHKHDPHMTDLAPLAALLKTTPEELRACWRPESSRDADPAGE